MFLFLLYKILISDKVGCMAERKRKVIRNVNIVWFYLSINNFVG